MGNEVNFVGLKNLTDHESSLIRKVSETEFEKVSRHMRDARLKLAVKTINSDGNARNYELTAMLDSPDARFEASNSGWNLSVVLHELFNSIHNQAKKRLKMKD